MHHVGFCMFFLGGFGVVNARGRFFFAFKTFHNDAVIKGFKIHVLPPEYNILCDFLLPELRQRHKPKADLGSIFAGHN
jgi:hypothetical protein